MKKPLIILPFLFVISHFLFLFSHNVHLVSPSEMFLPLAVALGFTLLLVLLSRLIFRGNHKVGIFVFIILILFFSYGYIFNLIDGWQIGNIFIGRHRYLILIWGMLFTSAIYFLYFTRKDLYNYTNFFKIVAISSMVISLINIGVYKVKTSSNSQHEINIINNVGSNTVHSESELDLRDIYYIILDGYASSNTLNKVYDYDNQNFIDQLTTKGFYVASKSHSNYVISFLSLASSLNMKYINYLTDEVGIESVNRSWPNKMIKSSKVMNSLKSEGYKFIHFSSGWGATDHNQFADYNINTAIINEFQMVVIQSTLLSLFEKVFGFVKFDERKRVLGTFSQLAEVHNIEGPKFIFAHIMCPHPPFLFGANGESVSDAKLNMYGTVWNQKENYINQLIFINKKVEMLVDEILAKSDIPPIIILQGDHGPASSFIDPVTYDDSDGWERPTDNMLKERTGIFNAYYLPLDGDQYLYNSITPVNSFRLIFNLYFNTTYKMLDDQIYFSNYTRPYEFFNVTNKVNYHIGKTNNQDILSLTEQ